MSADISNCRLCPRQCEVDRRVARGHCGAGAHLTINLWQRHLGEEPVISGTRGSGTIFFSHCNLRCVYCQNFKYCLDLLDEFGFGNGFLQEPVITPEWTLDFQPPSRLVKGEYVHEP